MKEAILNESLEEYAEKPLAGNGEGITSAFPALTGESRKALDARFRPAGMTGKQQLRFTKCQFNYAILNKYK